MNFKKRIRGLICLWLTALLFVGMLPVQALAEEPIPFDVRYRKSEYEADVNVSLPYSDDMQAKSAEELDFVMDDHTFLYWDVYSSGIEGGVKERYYAGDSMSGLWALYQNPTFNLTGVWAKNCYVTFDANGGSGSMPIQTIHELEEKALAANAYTRTNYRFTGWNTAADGSGIDYADQEVVSLSEDLNLYAQWEALPTYKVTFDPNGGTGEMGPYEVSHGEVYILPECGFTAPAGKRFSCWQVEDSVGFPDDEIIVECDVTVTAVWEDIPVVIHTVTYEADGGSGTMEPVEVADGEQHQLPECGFTAPEGMRFLCWMVEGSYVAPGRFITVTGDVTVTAVWEEIPMVAVYTVTFDANGGEGTMEPQYISEGMPEHLTTNTFTREGYTFVGWNTEPDGSGTSYSDGDQVSLTANLDLYAQWLENSAPASYTITYEANGGSGTMTPGVVAHGEQYTLIGCGFTAPSGKQFKCWMIGTDEYTPGDEITVVDNVTVIAVWEDIPVVYHTITFNSNNNTDATTSIQVAHGTQYRLPECTFTPAEGKVFNKWGIDGKMYNPGDTITVTSDLTVWAFWRDLFTVTYEANGGSGTMAPATVKAGEKHTLSANGFTAPAGKQFKCWKIGTAEYAPGDEITVDDNVTVIAVWEDIPVERHTVTFHANGGSGTMASVQVAHGTQYRLPECTFTPEEGQVFNQWGIDGKMYNPGDTITVTSDLTVMAFWREIFTVTYEANGGSGTMAPATVKYGEKHTLAANGFTAPAGKQFKCWKIGTDEYAPGDSIAVYANVTVTAVWEDIPVERHTVTFHANGGSGTMASVQVAHGEEYRLPECGFTPPEGWYFRYWMCDGLMYEVGDTITVTSDITVRALWRNTALHMLTFDAGGGSGTMHPYEVPHGFDFELPDCGFTAPSGKQFKCWKIGTAEYAPGDKITVTADVTVTAVWEAPVVTYTVSYEANGGSGTMASVQVAHGEQYRLPECGYTPPEGLQFMRWGIDGRYYKPGDTITVTSDVTVTPFWMDIPAATYTVTYDANGGRGYMRPVSVASGAEYILADNEFKAPSGKQFKCWKIGTKRYSPGDIITVRDDVTVTAVWKNKTSSADLDYVPKTGDSSGLQWLAAGLLLCTMALGAFALVEKKRAR